MLCRPLTAETGHERRFERASATSALLPESRHSLALQQVTFRAICRHQPIADAENPRRQQILGIARLSANAGRDTLKAGVARNVTIAVIEKLEMIDVEHRHCDGRDGVVTVMPKFNKPRVEVMPVMRSVRASCLEAFSPKTHNAKMAARCKCRRRSGRGCLIRGIPCPSRRRTSPVRPPRRCGRVRAHRHGRHAAARR
jgi:hypothetical protein